MRGSTMLATIPLRYALMAGVVSILVAPTAYAQARNTALAAGAPTAVDEITVVGQKEHYRGDVPIKEMAQSVQTLPGQLLTDLNITGFTSAMDFVSSLDGQHP